MERYDLVIVGAGPAGLTAGLYAARARADAVLMERTAPGGQVLNTYMVENWPGEVEGISGYELAERMRKHAERFGLKFSTREVRALKPDGELKILETDSGEIGAKAVILAVGASPRKLGVPGEELLTGKGVSYCATCDGPFYRDKVVACFGGGDTAAEEALFLTRFASKVYLIHRRDELRATAVLAERVKQHDKIEILWSHIPVAIEGTQAVEAVRLKDLKTGREYSLAVEGAFVFIGNQPNTEWLKGVVEMDEGGYIITDQDMATSVPGVFAAGDCRAKLLRQIVVAAGEGATAAFAAQRYLEGH